MALAELIARLERDAQARIDATLGGARAEVDRLTAEADRVLELKRDEELAARRRRRRARLEAELAAARSRAQAAELRARHAVLGRVFDRARQLLPTLESDPRFLEQLGAMIQQAAGYLGPDARARCRPSLRAALEGGPVPVVIDDAAPPGAWVEAEGGPRIDLTLLGLLERRRPRLAIELVGELPR